MTMLFIYIYGTFRWHTHTLTQRKTHTEHDTTSKAFITTVFAIHHAISCRCNSILMQNLLLLKNSTTPLKLCVDEHFPGINTEGNANKDVYVLCTFKRFFYLPFPLGLSFNAARTLAWCLRLLFAPSGPSSPFPHTTLRMISI